ncbi:hypothetical protein Pmani_027208 [Petrolisthes manimaculis]|uniref:Uncharacterized protein n=1 Tax=Petrolisthes manimaculis TaxID=1843537 RepID=A0AAE1P1J7_9EUCA|nr:hypothetical protein Pmani_028186 [Petrolisthes manimaculis]KAK4300598.1 hypothetical protein Pmani_027208 [Petrolisthes manimaculis]
MTRCPPSLTLPEPEVNVWMRLYIYGLHGFLIEVLFTAAWDFAVNTDWALVGLALRQYGACPWDYSERSYNLLGLITLEYFPAWYLASLLTEQLLIHNLLFLSLTPQDSHNRLHHKG